VTGCPIPDSGDPVVRAICLPSTWLGLTSNLLLPPTELSFWDDQATLEDREAAQRTAFDIVGAFQSDECLCPTYETGAGTAEQDVWDFGASSHGFSVVSGGHGSYAGGAWVSGKYQDVLTEYWHSELWIEKPISPTVWPKTLKAYTALACSSGPTLTFPTLQMILRSNEADPVGSWFTEFNAGYWTQATFRPLIQCQSYRSIKINLIEFRWHAVANSEAVIDLATCSLSRMDFDYELPTV